MVFFAKIAAQVVVDFQNGKWSDAVWIIYLV